MSLAPWCANEVWEFGVDAGGKRFAKVTGRERCPGNLKLNPLWWYRNDYEQQLSEAPWFEPDKSQADRERDWALRNPFQNANLFLWGVADRNYTVTVVEGDPDPMVVQRDDLQPPQYGWQRALLTLDDGSTKTWASYASVGLHWSWGCQPSGVFEVKLNFHKGA
jgi:hypothetical protein